MALTLTIVIGLYLNPLSVFCQSPRAQLNDTYTDVLEAEASGATAQEMTILTAQLNHAIQIQDQLQNVTLPSGKTRELVLELNETLVNTDREARDIIASNREMTAFLLRSTLAAVSALLVTIAYHWSTIIWRKYRIKRTFQMRIVPKLRS